jgi:hypothetical protein
MKSRIAAALLLALSLGTSAMAQNTNSSTTANTGMSNSGGMTKHRKHRKHRRHRRGGTKKAAAANANKR